MTVDITITDRRWVDDTEAPKGRKEVMMYAIRNETFLAGVITKYPNTGIGSMAQDVTTGTVFTLMGVDPVDWIKMGS
jgi:hypothetical protein